MFSLGPSCDQTSRTRGKHSGLRLAQRGLTNNGCCLDPSFVLGTGWHLALPSAGLTVCMRAHLSRSSSIQGDDEEVFWPVFPLVLRDSRRFVRREMKERARLPECSLDRRCFPRVSVVRRPLRWSVGVGCLPSGDLRLASKLAATHCSSIIHSQFDGLRRSRCFDVHRCSTHTALLDLSCFLLFCFFVRCILAAHVERDSVKELLE